MQNNVKINFTIISVLVFVFISLTFNHKSFCQEYDEIKIFKEMPDSLLKFSEDWLQPFYSSDIRNLLLQDKFYHDGVKSYGVYDYELSNIAAPVDEEDPDRTEYQVEINNQLNWISLLTNSNYYVAYLDFFLFPETKSYSIILYENYSENYDPKSVFIVSKYYFDKKSGTYIDQDLLIPDVDWSDFYSPEQLSVLNMDYLEYTSLQSLISFASLDNEVVLRILPNLNAVVFPFLGLMNHDYTDGNNYWDDDDMTRDSLGLSYLPEPNPIYYSLPDMKLLNSDEFELCCLYNSFCQRYEQNHDLDFTFKENTKLEELNIDCRKTKIEYHDSIMFITSKTKQKPDAKVFLINNEEKEYFVICDNSNGNSSESSLRVFECSGLYLFQEITQDVIQVDNKDFGIEYSENVFEKFPDVFGLKYEADQSSLKISLLVNPPFGNKVAEEIISKMSGESKVLVYKWSELIK